MKDDIREAIEEITRDMVVDRIMEVAELNIGAATACTKVMESVGLIGGLADVQYFDKMNIRGPLIWLCFKDVCGEDPVLLHHKVANETIADELAALPYSRYEKPKEENK